MLQTFAPYFFVTTVTLVVILIIMQYSRAYTLLRRWAYQNGYEIWHKELRWFNKGPFTLTTSRVQAVCYILARDRRGQARTGWVRFGDHLAWLWSDEVEVKWEASLKTLHGR